MEVLIGHRAEVLEAQVVPAVPDLQDLLVAPDPAQADRQVEADQREVTSKIQNKGYEKIEANRT